MSDSSSIAKRMKRYENVSEQHLTRRTPVIIRIDGRSFHSLTRSYFGKRYDHHFQLLMGIIGFHLYQDLQGCKFMYGQSDEISILLTDYQKIETGAWFEYDLQKIVSVSASLASSIMTEMLGQVCSFDSRAFNLPENDVVNYFIWRQQDATRNAIQMLGQEHFTQKELYKKNCSNIQELLFKKKGINFNDEKILRKRGWCIVDGQIDTEIPIFTQEREFIEKFVYLKRKFPIIETNVPITKTDYQEWD